MQLPAACRAVAEQRFEKLHRRGQDNRRVPVFRRKIAPAVHLAQVAAFVHRIFHVGVVRNDVLRTEDIFENLLRLLNNARVGNDINDAPRAVVQRMTEGKGHGADRLAAACGDCQRIKSLRLLPRLHKLPQDLRTSLIQRFAGIPPFRSILLQPPHQNRQCFAAFSVHGTILHEAFRIQPVRVHEAGIEHVRVKKRSLRRSQRRPRTAGGHADLIAKGCVWFDFDAGTSFQSAKEGRTLRRIHPAAAIRQTAVMAGDAECRRALAALLRLQRARRGMIHLNRFAADSLLESLGILPDIVHQAAEIRRVRRAEGRSKVGGHFCSRIQMIRQQLGTLVRSMRKIWLHVSASLA